MEELITFLLYAGFFYFMTPFICGAHMIHETLQLKLKKSIDLVCRMNVSQEKGYSKMYQGKGYCLCSRNYLIKFDDTPDLYLDSYGDTQ